MPFLEHVKKTKQKGGSSVIRKLALIACAQIRHVDCIALLCFVFLPSYYYRVAYLYRLFSLLISTVLLESSARA